MKQYRQWEEFYKRGEFYGIHQEIHLHVLPQEKRLYRKRGQSQRATRTVRGSIDLKTLGLNPAFQYVSADGLGTVENGRYQVQIELPPWEPEWERLVNNEGEFLMLTKSLTIATLLSLAGTSLCIGAPPPQAQASADATSAGELLLSGDWRIHEDADGRGR